MVYQSLSSTSRLLRATFLGNFPNSMYNPNVILFNNRLTVYSFHNAGKNLRSYMQRLSPMGGSVQMKTESFLSNSPIIEVELTVKS